MAVVRTEGYIEDRVLFFFSGNTRPPPCLITAISDSRTEFRSLSDIIALSGAFHVMTSSVLASRTLQVTAELDTSLYLPLCYLEIMTNSMPVLIVNPR